MSQTSHILNKISTAMAALTLKTSEPSEHGIALDLKETVQALDDAVGAMRRHIAINPLDPIDAAAPERFSDAALEREMQLLVEASIPESLPAVIEVVINPDEDRRMIARDFMSLARRTTTFKWDSVGKRGVVDISAAVALVLQTIDPYEEDMRNNSS